MHTNVTPSPRKNKWKNTKAQNNVYTFGIQKKKKKGWASTSIWEWTQTLTGRIHIYKMVILGEKRKEVEDRLRGKLNYH